MLNAVMKKGGLDMDTEEEDEGVEEEDEEDVEEDVEEEGVEEEEEEGDEDDEEDDDEEGAIDEESSDDDDDGDGGGDDEYNEDYLRSQTVSELKKLLDKMHERVLKKPKKKDDMINCLLSCKSVYTGGGYTGGSYSDNIMYGGRVNQSMYDNHFRGWGFTFLN